MAPMAAMKGHKTRGWQSQGLSLQVPSNEFRKNNWQIIKGTGVSLLVPPLKQVTGILHHLESKMNFNSRKLATKATMILKLSDLDL